MLRITATELKNRTGEYIARAATEDVIITKNGVDIAVIKSAEGINKQELKALRGIIKDTLNIDRNTIREERLAKYENQDTD